MWCYKYHPSPSNEKTLGGVGIALDREAWIERRVELLEGADRYTTTGQTQTQRRCAFGNYVHVNVKYMCQ